MIGHDGKESTEFLVSHMQINVIKKQQLRTIRNCEVESTCLLYSTTVVKERGE